MSKQQIAPKRIRSRKVRREARMGGESQQKTERTKRKGMKGSQPDLIVVNARCGESGRMCKEE
jgi:hypothetical protein